MNKAFFLDRDGVIVVETDYLGNPDEVEIIAGTSAALKMMRQAGYLIVVVSNQSGVARGYYDEVAVKAVNGRIAGLLAAEGAKVDAFYHCPHHPDFSGVCNCRKPEPGMLLQAAAELDIDIGQSYMIGDKLSDVAAGRRAGCADSLLLRTGHGATLGGVPADVKVADDLLAAVKMILSEVAG